MNQRSTVLSNVKQIRKQDKFSIMIGLTFYFTNFFFSCDGNNPLLLVSSSKRQLCVKCGRQRKNYSFFVFPPEELNNEERLQLERRKSMTIFYFLYLAVCCVM